jgi:acetolactate synthase-1/2/3 large subunit
MATMTGAQAVVRGLARAGVEVVFGLPGVQIMPLYDAFWGQTDIRLLTVRHEQTTVYMADGYARVAGKPGVALVVPGPGVQNASAALGTAYACSSPVMLVAGQVESAMLGQDRGALHEINDQLDIVRPITKWCRRVLAAGDIPAAIHEGLRHAGSGRPRPTVVEIPPDVLAAEADMVLPAPEAPSLAAPDAESIGRAARLLGEATRPLIWAGGGVVLADAAAELTAVAQELNIRRRPGGGHPADGADVRAHRATASPAADPPRRRRHRHRQELPGRGGGRGPRAAGPPHAARCRAQRPARAGALVA